MESKAANSIRRADIENVYRDIWAECPDLRDDPWMNRMYWQFRLFEDESERAPPLSEIFDDYEEGGKENE